MPVDYTNELAVRDYSSELDQQDFSGELTASSRAIGFGKPKTRPVAQAIGKLFQTTPFQPTVTLPMSPEEAGDVVLGRTGSPLLAAGAKTGREVAEGLTSPVNLALSLLNPALAGIRAGMRAPTAAPVTPAVAAPSGTSVRFEPTPAPEGGGGITELARRFQTQLVEQQLGTPGTGATGQYTTTTGYPAELAIPGQARYITRKAVAEQFPPVGPQSTGPLSRISPTMPERGGEDLLTHKPGFLQTGEERIAQRSTGFQRTAEEKMGALLPKDTKLVLDVKGQPIPVPTRMVTRAVPSPLPIPLSVMPGSNAVSPAIPVRVGPNNPPPGPPVSPTSAGSFSSGWRRDWQRLQGFFRWDRAMLDAVPNTPVLSNIEALRAGPQAELQALIASPTYQNLRAVEKQVEQLEYDAITKGVPFDPRLQAVNDSVNASTTAVNEVYKRRGLPTVSLIEGPYVPRRTSEQWADENLVRQGFAGGQGARTGIGPYERDRVFPTIREGRQGGVEYRTATESALWHEAYNRLVLATDRMMTNLEQDGVLNRTKPDALARAVVPSQVLNVKGLPFEPPGGWWVRSIEEGRMLQQNLRPSPGGTFTHFFNQVVRNPGLVIPNKHILNMLDKFGVSGGDWTKMFPYFSEIEYSPTPKYKAEFNKYVPMTEGTTGTWQDMFHGGNISQQIAQATPIDWTKPSSVGTKMLEYISKTNDPSAYIVFNHVDMSLRYARWRQYLDEYEQTGAIRGYKPTNLDEAMQVAGNHVMLDLVRYGARSARLDYLKAFPLNFYAAWRTGSLSTVLKAAKYSSISALMYVGAMDLLRLHDYRQNTYTHHRFWDYVERPLAAMAEAAQTIYQGKPGAWQEASTELTKALVGQAAFGPGGDITARNLEAVFRDLQGKVAPEEAMRMFLVLNTVYSVVPEMQQYKKTDNLKYLANAFLSVLINRRPALMQKPRMLLDYIIPEVGPFERSGQTKTVEALQEAIKDVRYSRMDVSKYVKEATEKGMSPEDLAIFRLTKQLAAAGGRSVRQ